MVKGKRGRGRPPKVTKTSDPVVMESTASHDSRDTPPLTSKKIEDSLSLPTPTPTEPEEATPSIPYEDAPLPKDSGNFSFYPKSSSTEPHASRGTLIFRNFFA